MALVAEGAGVGFVYDHALRARPNEFVATPVGLDEVHGHDDVRVDVEQRLGASATPFEAAGRARQHQFNFNVELVIELRLPLFREVGRAQDGGLVDLPPVQEFPDQQACLDRLADADIVGDEQADRVELQPHQQRHELVRARLHGDPTERAERPGRSSGADTDGVSQEATRGVVPHSLGVGQIELRGFDGLQSQVNPGHFVVRAA